MKKILFLLVTSVLIAGITQAQGGAVAPAGIKPPFDPGSWSRFTVKGEEFSVLLPTLPAMTTNKGLRNSDQKQQSQRHLKTSLDEVVYSIEVFENPKPRQSLDEFIAEQTLNAEYDPASERRLVIYGVPGKEYSSLDKDSPTVVQFFATEKRLYRFLASGPYVEAQAVRAFFSSIKLGKEAYGIEVSDGPGTQIQAPAYTGEKIYTGREVDVKARLLTKPEPMYTADARKNEISGIVILKVVFAKTGQVTNIRVVAGLPYGLTEQAINAGRQIKFTPAMKDGKPVSMWMQLEYNFSL